MADEQKWHATPPRRPHDPIKVVHGGLAGLGGCGLLWALTPMAIFAVDPDRPYNPVDSTTPTHATPRYPASAPPSEIGRESPPSPPAHQSRGTS